MTHETDEFDGWAGEGEYQELVAAWLAHSFADVETEVVLASWRRPDVVASTPFETYVLEIEDSWDLSSVYQGIGQALVYAAETGHTPVVVLPAEDVDTELHEMLAADPAVPRIETV